MEHPLSFLLKFLRETPALSKPYLTIKNVDCRRGPSGLWNGIIHSASKSEATSCRGDRPGLRRVAYRLLSLSRRGVAN